jgi:hypothetical protein
MPDISQPVAVTGSGGVLGIALYIVYELIKKHNTRKQAELYAKTEQSSANDGPPPQVFAPVVAPIQQQHANALQHLSNETETQAQRARLLTIEAELLAVQQSMRKLRVSLDESAFEQGRMKAALIEERGNSERTSLERDAAVTELAQVTLEKTHLQAAVLEERSHNKQLLAELARLRREGGDSGTDPRERRGADRGPSGGLQHRGDLPRDVRAQTDALRRRAGRSQDD